MGTLQTCPGWSGERNCLYLPISYLLTIASELHVCRPPGNGERRNLCLMGAWAERRGEGSNDPCFLSSGSRSWCPSFPWCVCEVVGDACQATKNRDFPDLRVIACRLYPESVSLVSLHTYCRRCERNYESVCCGGRGPCLDDAPCISNLKGGIETCMCGWAGVRWSLLGLVEITRTRHVAPAYT